MATTLFATNLLVVGTREVAMSIGLLRWLRIGLIAWGFSAQS